MRKTIRRVSIGIGGMMLPAMLSFGVIAVLSSCGGSSSGSGGSNPGGVIQVAPSGTAAHPVDEGCHSFNIYATEAAYSGDFSISMSGGNGYYRLPKQIITNGVWTISPGLICEGGSKAATAMFTITDQDGHSAPTFITTF